jgi:phosphoglycolate phosphatase
VLGRSGLRGPVGFDLDMTLIDSRPTIMAAFGGLAGEAGVSIDLAAVDARLGIKLEDELAYWFPPDGIAAAAETYRRHYVRLAERMTTALPGAQKALEAVRATGEHAVIITAKHQISVGPDLGATGIADDEVFTHVHGPEKVAVLSRLHAVADVGDTPADMAAAAQAGALAIGVATRIVQRPGSERRGRRISGLAGGRRDSNDGPASRAAARSRATELGPGVQASLRAAP